MYLSDIKEVYRKGKVKKTMTKQERDVMKAKINSMIESLPTSRDSGLVGEIAELQVCYYCDIFRLKPSPSSERGCTFTMVHVQSVIQLRLKRVVANSRR